MDQEVLSLVTVGALILLVVVGIVTLVLVARLYNRVAPSGWDEFLGNLISNQEKITSAFGDLAENHQKERELLQHLVNATFSLTEEVNRLKNAQK